MATGRFRIKQAAPEELLPAARTVAACWRETYPFAEAVFDMKDARTPQQAEGWDLRSQLGEYFWIVVDHEAEPEPDGLRPIVGVAHAAVSEDKDAPTPLLLDLMYLRQLAQGSGIADRLIEMAIGDAPAYLWVLERNERALAFYRRHGFELDGVRKPLTGGMEGWDDLRMVRG
ncbi:GNAT family N-acetyltransferase [Parenemella sanctibonifatiensis]|uniref:N-acetyltransferase domain-containing protein n=1 Tax=Parenemella sanctibonifatiensis TaxID=2016505 RepID=A0A255EEU1_9ACTN|nr:GNAT family N-acetyltransferase [Parenemella sanctibonifatiensis]OYN88095.1 hypothetical protein CGZ92_05635 [Parenemella sanctibonifatiensis]